MGSGTTLVEAKLLGRNAVGIDINPQSVSISETNLQFQCDTSSKIYIREGNAAELHFIKDAHVDFICTHPPYADIIKYSEGIEGDISMLGVKPFIDAMDKVAYEAYRVLKKGKMCAVMVGDIRKCGWSIIARKQSSGRLRQVTGQEQLNRWMLMLRLWLGICRRY